MPFSPPLDRLLTLGEPLSYDRRMSYATLGITDSHVADLIRMSVDVALHSASGESPLVWAPIHAWRALGELRATEAIEPLLGLVGRVDQDDDDWVATDLPHVFAAMGSASIPAVAAFLADAGHGEYARSTAAQTLARIGRVHAELRADCISRLTAQLANFIAESPGLNGLIVSALLDLRAVEAAAVMEPVFASGNIDTMIVGDWEDVQVELGLKPMREHLPAPNRLAETARQFREVIGMPELDTVAHGGGRPGWEPLVPVRVPPKVGRNEPCPCGSGKKFKKCCGG